MTGSNSRASGTSPFTTSSGGKLPPSHSPSGPLTTFGSHVYSASRNTMSRPAATVLTFLISAIAHELIMGCITRKFRGYGFVAMMLQMPIVLLQRSKWVRNRSLLNNVLFWCSMILGLSMVSDRSSGFREDMLRIGILMMPQMCALYVLV